MSEREKWQAAPVDFLAAWFGLTAGGAIVWVLIGMDKPVAIILGCALAALGWMLLMVAVVAKGVEVGLRQAWDNQADED